MDFDFEKIFRLIFEKSNYGINFVDIDGHIVLANPRFLGMLGYKEQEILGMNFKDITYSEDLEKVLKSFEDIRVGKGEYYQLEKRYIKKDGSFLWVISNSFLIKDLKEIPYLMEIVEDITEIKRIEAELNKIYQAVEQASDWVVITDVNGNIEYANKVV